jgi:DNA-directed RNA polymerase specialized sigma24 family protein
LDDSLAAGQFDDEQQQVWQEQKSQCMKDCLNCLPSDQKRLLVMYYGGDEKTRASNRRRLAKDLRISDQALRVRVHRLRYVLKERYEACLKRRHLK